MKTPNFDEKIHLFLKTNPKLSHTDLGILLLIDSIYREVPEDVEEYRRVYAHMDPRMVEEGSQGLTFLKIAMSKEPMPVVKQRLNRYINVKYNYIGESLSYKENMVRFREHSQIISQVLDSILRTARFPKPVTRILREREDVRNLLDFFDMVDLYRNTDDRRVRFEILRKLGLMILLSRINHSILVEDADFALDMVQRVFRRGLGLKRNQRRKVYFWLDQDNRVRFGSDAAKVAIRHERACKRRFENALETFPYQVFRLTSFITKFGTEVAHLSFRNKLRHGDRLTYASFIEKIIRNNYEFPNQIHDVIGVKVVVPEEDQIHQLIANLEAFLGGSSTRKQEKNTLHRFGKKKLSPYSSPEYTVWKAIYDITMPHPSLAQVKKILGMTRENEVVQKELTRRLAYFNQRKKDFVVEVQLQDLPSFLLSIAHGSPTEHAVLKTNQVRSNSFFKVFPKEIFESELLKLKREILMACSTVDHDWSTENHVLGNGWADERSHFLG